MDEVVITSTVRTAIGNFLGGLSPFTATELGGKVIEEAVKRNFTILNGKAETATKLKSAFDARMTVGSLYLCVAPCCGTHMVMPCDLRDPYRT